MVDKNLLELFSKKFSVKNNPVVVRAPGRVNLIGEHTDYNGGYVLPVAIDRWITIAAQPREDDIFKIYSMDYSEEVVFSLHKIEWGFPQWANYPKGVIELLLRNKLLSKGADMIVAGDIPRGIGLSSSAAIETAFAFALQSVFHFELSLMAMAKICQRTEKEFVGVNCGIMDQFVSGFGKENTALFLDCQTLEYQHIPFALGDYSLVTVNSGISHQLVKSEYNQRRKECEEGVRLMNQLHSAQSGAVAPFENLRGIDLATFTQYSNSLPPVIARRSQHVISENARVLRAVDVLKNHDLKTFGQLMNQSHQSLRDDYEVSCPEVDCLVDTAQSFSDCLGARMTGAGFGGCTINLVKTSQIHEFQNHLSNSYQKHFARTCQFFDFKIVNGAEELPII